MCGRFTRLYSWKDLQQASAVVCPASELKKSYNVAPGQLSVILKSIKEQGLVAMQSCWGLVPSWSQDTSFASSCINARAETVNSKASYRAAFKSRRCLVPISGYYEWQVMPGEQRKQPYYIKHESEGILFLAGLWERWQKQPGEALESFTILTSEAPLSMAEIHNRIPVLLRISDLDTWLHAQAGDLKLQELLEPRECDFLRYYKVATTVNSPENDSESCILEVS